ncbi:MAG: iron ABC transporter permease [Bacteroidota bacterium]
MDPVLRKHRQKQAGICVALAILTVVLFLADLCYGAVSISLSEIIDILSGKATHAGHAFIINDFRLPKAITALTAGAAIAVSGLIMQTFFRNPLAGPFVLGVSSGASLGVALLVMAGSIFGSFFIYGQWAIILAGLIGSALVLTLVVMASSKVNDPVSLLIIGLMFGSFTSAIVSVLQYFSIPELVQAYLFWTFGSLSGVGWEQLSWLVPAVVAGLLLSLMLRKNLNLLLLGEHYAVSLGMNVKRNRFLVIVVTCLLAGVVTAFCGPIAFLGMAVPHLARNLMNTADHGKLIPVTALLGAILLLFCDICTQLPGKDLALPINALTSLIGAPVVIAIILKRNKASF